jgi:hypothetical protein
MLKAAMSGLTRTVTHNLLMTDTEMKSGSFRALPNIGDQRLFFRREA